MNLDNLLGAFGSREPRNLWYDKQGKVIDARQVEDILANRPEYKRIGGTVIMSGSDPSQVRLWVSTVWLGLDHSFGPAGPPLIFETMVFKDGGGGLEEECHRYATESEAITGHEMVVKTIMDGIPDAISLEDSSGEGFFLSPEERGQRLAESAIMARELMAELEASPKTGGLQ